MAHKHKFQATPVLADGMLYFATAFGRVFAVDALSGEERWRFELDLDLDRDYSEAANRGVLFWRDAVNPRAAALAADLITTYKSASKSSGSCLITASGSLAGRLRLQPTWSRLE